MSATLEPVIGVEVHVQLKTRTKLFCGDAVDFGATPNTNVCPVCLGLPGALPVTNRAAVELGVRAALGFNCAVHERSVFARKNYFYPDLPKGYQITQFDRPLATAGWLDAPRADGELQRVRIRRIHLEEDAGKSLHDRLPRKTAIDLNRAGTPLIEIVTEPDLTSPAHARAFLTRLKQLLQYLEVSDCDMEKGSLRVDANVSVRAPGSSTLGTKTEVKNMNSFANVERALQFEIARQITLIGGRGIVTQQTLLWDAARNVVRPMRSKEESHDYRYFPEPDLPVLELPNDTIVTIRSALPELPQARVQRFVEHYKLPQYDAEVLTADRSVADFYEAVAREVGDAKAASNWVMTDVLASLKQRQQDIAAFPLRAIELARLIRLVLDGTISNSTGRQVYTTMLESGRAAREIVDAGGLAQLRDASLLDAWIGQIISAHPGEVVRYRAGETKLLSFFMGRLMKLSNGTADPRLATDAIRSALEKS